MLFHRSSFVTAKSNSKSCFNVIKVCSFVLFFPLFSFSEEPLVLDGFPTSCFGCRKVNDLFCEISLSQIAERVPCEEIVAKDIQVARAKNLVLDFQALVSYLAVRQRGSDVSKAAIVYLLSFAEGCRAISGAKRNFFALYVNALRENLKTTQVAYPPFWEALWAYTREMREEEALPLRAFIVERSFGTFTLKDYFEEYPALIENVDLFLKKSETFFVEGPIKENIRQTRLLVERCVQNIQRGCDMANAPDASRDFLRELGVLKVEKQTSLSKEVPFTLPIVFGCVLAAFATFLFLLRRKKNRERFSLEELLARNLSYFNLTPKASVSDLERAFKVKAKKVHPDVLGGNVGQFYLLTERYHKTKELLATIKANAK